MKVSFNPTRLGKARIWLDELPDAHFVPTAQLVESVTNQNAHVVPTRRAGIELMLPVGPMGMYALSGAEYLPAAHGQTTITVNIGDGMRNHEPSLALPPDTVHVGLLGAFANGIVAGIKEDAALVESLPAGTISFICAAHAEVGSSFSVFKTIGRSVLRLLFFDNRSPAPEELEACLDLAHECLRV